MIKFFQLIQYLILFYLIAASHTAYSHEFWLEPKNFTPKANQNIVANLKVGQNFKGQPLAFMTVNFESFELQLGNHNVNENNSQDISSRFGDIPAVDQKPAGTGINILSYVSGNSTAVYPSAEKFSQFLEKEGLNWVLKEHKKRGLPELGFTEAYQRFSKSLIAVDNAHGNDYPLGLRFEWIVETNPYTKPFPAQQMISAQLRWQGNPFANSRAIVFTNLNNNISHNFYTTDSNGRIQLPAQTGAIYMISAVNMIEPDKSLATSTGAVWKSLWASTTFQIPDK